MDSTPLRLLIDRFVAADSRRGLLRLLAALSLLGPLASLLADQLEVDARRRHQRNGGPPLQGDRKKKRKKRRRKKKKKKRRKSRRKSPPPCVPRTCPAGACGPVPDGCGGTLNCGGCPANQICLRSNVCQPCSVLCNGTPEQCGNNLHEALQAGGVYFVCPGLYRRQNGFVAGADPVTLIGAGQGEDPASDTILESDGNTRVLTIPPGSPPVTLERVRIRLGREITTSTATIYGGAVYLQQNSTLRMIECAVSRNNLVNNVMGAFARGGAIAVESGSTLELTGCSVQQNGITGNSGVGGAIWTAGTTTLTDTLIESNSAESFGGAINIEGGTTTLQGSTLIRRNTARIGGGIYITNGTLQIAETCRITQNTARNGMGAGGGIFLQGGTVTLQGASPTSPIVVDNCTENCAPAGAIARCSTAPPVTCPP